MTVFASNCEAVVSLASCRDDIGCPLVHTDTHTPHNNHGQLENTFKHQTLDKFCKWKSPYKLWTSFFFLRSSPPAVDHNVYCLTHWTYGEGYGRHGKQLEGHWWWEEYIFKNYFTQKRSVETLFSPPKLKWGILPSCVTQLLTFLKHFGFKLRVTLRWKLASHSTVMSGVTVKLTWSREKHYKQLSVKHEA